MYSNAITSTATINLNSEGLSIVKSTLNHFWPHLTTHSYVQYVVTGNGRMKRPKNAPPHLCVYYKVNRPWDKSQWPEWQWYRERDKRREKAAAPHRGWHAGAGNVAAESPPASWTVLHTPAEGQHPNSPGSICQPWSGFPEHRTSQYNSGDTNRSISYWPLLPYNF